MYSYTHTIKCPKILTLNKALWDNNFFVYVYIFVYVPIQTYAQVEILRLKEALSDLQESSSSFRAAFGQKEESLRSEVEDLSKATRDVQHHVKVYISKHVCSNKGLTLCISIYV